MSNRVPAADAQVRRVQAEAHHAEQWRRLCDPETTGVPISELAEHHLGLPRSKLYESFEAGQRHARLAWIVLLPAPAELRYLRERAQAHGYELASASTEHATLADVVGEAGRVLAALAATEADGHISPDEARTDIAAIRRLEEQLSKAKVAREVAIERRGLNIAGGRR